MSVATLSEPSVRSALFPPPAVPLLFTDGDRYVWTHTGEVWTRTNGWWVPSLGDGQDDGTGWWTDAEVSASLHRAVESWDVRQQFVPAQPRGILPGRVLLALPPVRDAAQYVLDHQGAGLVPLRELVARHDEDSAYDIPAVISGTAMTDVLTSIVAEHFRASATYDEAAGRGYVQYLRPAEQPGTVKCLHVFVLAAPLAEA
ncbi:hypothetical protein ACFYY1_41905 [Streptomyces sp. NPDC001890]|uniref:hypothetical protein n=1 Tax=unclassified Streptomyces TaxID=2593676 RepID=UPI003323E722